MSASRKDGMTLAEAVEGFIAHVEQEGKSAITVRAYRSDLRLAERFFGAETALARLTVPWVGKFLKSEALNQRPNGTPKKPASISRAKGVLRMMLEWAVAQGHLENVPLPKGEQRRAKRANVDATQ